MTFGPQVCGDLDAGANREWLVADGLGGYAMGTVSGLRTRRYHALQVVSGSSPAARMVGLVALDPVCDGHRLGVHEWAGGAVAPDGHRFLERFDLIDGLPRWRWRIGGVVLERELAMAHGFPTLAVVYRLVAASGPVELAVDALVTWRDAHGERRRGEPGGDLQVEPVDGGVVVADAYRLRGPGWRAGGTWWLDVHTREEAARGLAATEDVWHAGAFAATLHPGETMELTCWARDLAQTPPPAGRIISAAHARNRAVVAHAGGDPLALAADAFVIAGPHGPDVVAGYPWFGTWSRDTMISYPGLLLATARADEGRELLRGYAATLSQGMLANTADTGHTEYNTADATLWFLYAVERHVAATGDTDLAADLLPGLLDVIAAHVAGTRYHIKIDPADGLLGQGADGFALTWMDARIDGAAVTPRQGKAVELNALWINGLGAVAALGALTGTDTGEIERRRAQSVTSFAHRFPCGDRLYDVVDGPDGDDPTLRPNQVLAYSLPHPALPPDPAVLATVSERLLTPLGLRTLDPADSRYRPSHHGGPAARDQAYHQGTVWPWLLGPYVDAIMEKSQVVTISPLAALDAHLTEWGLGSISETADGEAPHRATGCPFQAWSVAETFRIRRRIG
jgi:predicted glycogen debranching enzyme